MCSFSLLLADHLVGLVVKASASGLVVKASALGVADLGFDSRFLS